MSKNITILIIGVVIGTLVGFAIFWIIYSDNSLDNTNNAGGLENSGTFEEGWKAAENRLQETGSYFQINSDNLKVNSINGTITSVNNPKLGVKITPLSPLAKKDLDERIVEIKPDTKIIKKVKKNEIEYQKELNSFYDNNPDLSASAGLEQPLPSPFIDTQVSFSDFSLGQNLLVISTLEDIKNTKSFIAKEVIIQY